MFLAVQHYIQVIKLEIKVMLYMDKVHKVYFDTCCYNRPFDDLKNERVRLEAEAILMIQGLISGGAFELFYSRVIDFELNKIKDIDKKMKVKTFYQSIKGELLEFRDEIETIANIYETHGIRYMDALHIAYCRQYRIDYMLTTDKALINAARRIEIIFKVINPLEFIMEVL